MIYIDGFRQVICCYDLLGFARTPSTKAMLSINNDVVIVEVGHDVAKDEGSRSLQQMEVINLGQ